MWRCFLFSGVPDRSRPCLILVVAFVVIVFAGHSPAQLRGEAWVDGRAMTLFELGASTGSGDTQSLLDRIKEGQKKSLALIPPDEQILQVEGAGDGVVNRVTIDLSHGAGDPRYKKPKLSRQPSGKPALLIHSLEARGSPYFYHNALVEYSLRAGNVRLDEYLDRNGNPLLVMSSADNARVEFAVRQEELQRLVLGAARQEAKRHGVTVHSVWVRLISINERSMFADLRVRAGKGLISGGLRLTARIDIDDQMNARTSRLTCHGQGPWGALIAAFLGPAMKKYDGQVKPLIGFPTEGLELRDVRMTMDDTLRVIVEFGGTRPGAEASVASFGEGS